MIHQIMAGALGGENIRKVRAEDIMEWPAQWADYQGLEPMPIEGTRLEDVPGMTEHFVLHLRLIHIQTAEQLAETSDAVIQSVLGGQGMRNAARLLVEKNREAEAAERSMKEVRALRAEIESLRSQVQPTERRGPGRPRKDDMPASPD